MSHRGEGKSVEQLFNPCFLVFSISQTPMLGLNCLNILITTGIVNFNTKWHFWTTLSRHWREIVGSKCRHQMSHGEGLKINREICVTSYLKGLALTLSYSSKSFSNVLSSTCFIRKLFKINVCILMCIAEQWFSTGVPQRSSRDAANLYVKHLLTSKSWLRLLRNCFITLKGFREAKKVENHCTRGQFHQHFTSSFCANNLAPKTDKAKLPAQKFFGARLSEQKLLVKC